ncbi:hypothetical protein ACFL1X_05390 [Candidatus Hydrogenedentota bacterium]
MEYTVTWTIELDAESFDDAARIALEIQRDKEAVATQFDITAETGEKRNVWASTNENNSRKGGE